LLTTNPIYLNTDIPREPKVRERLPVFKNPNEKINIWSIIKDAIGKDLTKFSVPVYLNEPLSMLQRLSEQMEYAECLNEASKYDDSCLRMAFVMAFAFSPYCQTISRTKKPFNPLLAETFEIVDDEKGYKFIAE